MAEHRRANAGLSLRRRVSWRLASCFETETEVGRFFVRVFPLSYSLVHSVVVSVFWLAATVLRFIKRVKESFGNHLAIIMPQAARRH